jgi:hypothetical protein
LRSSSRAGGAPVTLDNAPFRVRMT